MEQSAKPLLDAHLLDEAVGRGIIDADQRIQLLALAHDSNKTADSPQDGSAGQPEIRAGDEPFRLVSGGMDVFVGIGTFVLLNGATAAFVQSGMGLTATLVVTLVLTWALGEFLSRKLRLKFTSLILALAFAPTAAVMIYRFIHEAFDLDRLAALQNASGPAALLQAITLRGEVRLAVWSGLALMATLAVLHFWRFRVPVMSAVMAICALAFGGAIALDLTLSELFAGQINYTAPEFLPQLGHTMLIVMLICGLGLFLVGVALDLMDRHRNRVVSDCAFWMHVLSAPLIVHPIVALMTGRLGFASVMAGQEAGQAIGPGTGTIVLVALLVVVFFYISLVIDRRSLLVPSLGYLAIIAAWLMIDSGISTGGSSVFPFVMLLVGGSVIMFGVLWHRLRALVVRNTLPHMIVNKLPPLVA